MNLYNKLKNNMKKNKEQKEDIVNETNDNIDVILNYKDKKIIEIFIKIYQ